MSNNSRSKNNTILKLEATTLEAIETLVKKRKKKKKRSNLKQLHRQLKLVAAIYAFCKRLPQHAFVTERALYYHLKSTFPAQRAMTSVLQRLTSALGCPRQ